MEKEIKKLSVESGILFVIIIKKTVLFIIHYYQIPKTVHRPYLFRSSNDNLVNSIKMAASYLVLSGFRVYFT